MNAAAEVIAGRQAFPRWVLKEGHTALVLFAAAFHGAQDARFIADADMHATCVDTDHEKLGQMVLDYPEGWEYVHADAFQYALATERRWDVVSLDPFTNLFDRCASTLAVWTGLAREAVVLGCGPSPKFRMPTGWQLAEIRKRSDFNGGTYWAVITRA